MCNITLLTQKRLHLEIFVKFLKKNYCCCLDDDDDDDDDDEDDDDPVFTTNTH